MANKFVSIEEAKKAFCYFSCCSGLGTEKCKTCEHPFSKLPAADVVEVVRCKDCANAEKGDSSSLFPFCKRLNQFTSNNFYCACGERRTG